MSYIQLSRTTIAVLLGAFLLHSCQQPQLSMAGDELKQQAPSTPQALSPKARQSTEATTKQEPSRVVLTSSSDSSPEAKHADAVVLDRGTTAQFIVNVPQGSVLALANTDKIITEASSKEVKRKRPATAQKLEEQQAVTKQAKIEAPSPSHKDWFALFTQTLAQIEEDLGNETAWDNMDQILDKGAKLNLLTASITCPNDSNPATTYQYTPLHYAAARGILELVRELVKPHNVPVDIQTQDNGSTPLHLAASRGRLDVVRFLVENGAEVDKIDSEGGSTLQYAAAGKRGEMNRDVIEYLVSMGADLTRVTDTGTSLLGLAVFSSNLPVVEYWVDKFSNNSSSKIIALTKKALKVASRLKEKGHKGQGPIICMLKEFLEEKSH